MLDIEIRKNNIQSSKDYGKYFGHTVKRETVELEQLASKIQDNCTVKSADVFAVLTELAEVIKRELADGKAVSLPDIGTLQLSVESTGADSPATFTKRNIKRITCKFRPTGSRPKGQRNGPLSYPLTEGVRIQIKR